MTVARSLHTATLLPNGKVLVVGGVGISGVSLASAEIYDPVAGTFAATGGMAVARASHTQTLLPNGTVLIAGGEENGSSAGNGGAPTALGTAELYDPAAGVFAPAGNMTTVRFGHTAVLLPNGKVLIAGGVGSDAILLTSAELFDPAAGVFTATGGLPAGQAADSATLLSNGMVLVDGASGGQLYDQGSGVFTPAGNMTVVRYGGFTATALPNGEVLIAGGGDNGNPSAGRSAELYDPMSLTFKTTGSMMLPRSFHTATLLPNGSVLVAGGTTELAASPSAEVYDPATFKFTTVGDMGTARYLHTATLLPRGEILIVGGRGPNGSLASAELYNE